ncbi:MAG TPA: TonB-dependent receptor plug domain-containing protein, partial [Candidatus Acidoferrales bacterium]
MRPVSGITYRFTQLLHPRVLLRIVFLALFVSVLSASAQQPTAKIEGQLTDPSDAAVSGATITLQKLSSTSSREQSVSAVSENDGRFHLDAAPGKYRLTITHASLARVDQELDLRAGETREINVRMAIEPLAATIVVSAEAQPIATTAASEPVSIVTRDEIDQRQAHELAPLLETLPGFSFGQTGPAGGVTSIFLDGGNSNFTKVLIDGIPANLAGGAVDFSNLTLENVDKVEVVHGGQSALSGSDAVTGTVEILTHRGTTRTPILTLESDGGAFATGRGTA